MFQSIAKTLTIVSLLLSGCGTSKTKLTSKGTEVRVLTYKKGHGCAVVAKVVGENDGGSLELAKNHARNLAADKGANAIYFDEDIQNGNVWKVHATAYQCP